MRVVDTGRSKKPRVTRNLECNHCPCTYEIQSGDERAFKRVSDQRDGDYYEVKCP